MQVFVQFYIEEFEEVIFFVGEGAVNFDVVDVVLFKEGLDGGGFA